MDNFSTCVALGPLAIYLLLLGAIHLSRRPLVVSGTRETLALGLALLGLVAVGPMRLFMPLDAASHYGQAVWLLLGGFYALCLVLLLLVSRPRLVVYNVSAERLRAALSEVAKRLDPDATWIGSTLSMPLVHVQLQVDEFTPMGNVSLVATSDEQSVGNWRRLERSLRQALSDVPALGRAHGVWLTVCALTILTMLVWRAAGDPQTIARGLERMLRP